MFLMDLRLACAALALVVGAAPSRAGEVPARAPVQNRLMGLLPAVDTDGTARFAAAKRAMEQGSTGEALAYLEGLEVVLPEVADLVWALQAEVHRRQGNWPQALARWQRVLSFDVDSPAAANATFGAADAYYALGDTRQAYKAYGEALAHFPSSPSAAIAQLNLGRLAEARGDYAAAAASNNALYFRRPSGTVSDLAGERLKALATAGRIAPPSVRTRLGRVDRLLATGELTAVATELESLGALSLDTRDALSLSYRRAHLAYRQRDFDRAIALFTELRGSRPSSTQLTYDRWIARCYAAASRFDEALSVYLDIATRYPTHRDGREALFKAAWLAYDARRHDQAIQLFTLFMQRYAKDRAADEAQWYLAWNHFLAGSMSQAADALTALTTAFPRSSLRQRSLYWLGRSRGELGDVGSARSAYEAARAEAPLSYYGALARQRLEQMPVPEKPIAFAGGSTLLASLDAPPIPAVRDDDDEAPADTDRAAALDDAGSPDATGAQESASAADDIPFAFNWSTPAARRLVALAAIDDTDAAAALVGRLVPTGAVAGTKLSLARARLLASLGAYNAAYEIASRYVDNTEEVHTSDMALLALAYPLAHEQAVHAAAREFGVSPALILAVMRQESAFRSRARSWAGARGLMQIISRTGARIATELQVAPFDAALLDEPQVNIRFGTWYLGKLLDKYYGHVALAVGSYNAGPIAVASWLDRRPGVETDVFVEEIPYKETRNYVKRVLSNLAVYSYLQLDAELRLPASVPPTHLNNVDF